MQDICTECKTIKAYLGTVIVGMHAEGFQGSGGWSRPRAHSRPLASDKLDVPCMFLLRFATDLFSRGQKDPIATDMGKWKACASWNTTPVLARGDRFRYPRAMRL